MEGLRKNDHPTTSPPALPASPSCLASCLPGREKGSQLRTSQSKACARTLRSGLCWAPHTRVRAASCFRVEQEEARARSTERQPSSRTPAGPSLCSAGCSSEPDSSGSPPHQGCHTPRTPSPSRLLSPTLTSPLSVFLWNFLVCIINFGIKSQCLILLSFS